MFIGATILRREAFERAGPFDPELVGTEDWELWLRMGTRMTFGFFNSPLAQYTRHLGTLSSNKERMTNEFCKALRKTLHRCHDLAPQERALVANQLRFHLFDYGYQAYDRGDYRVAKVRFGQLMSECRISLRGVLYWALCARCHLPHWQTARHQTRSFASVVRNPTRSTE